MKKRKLNYQIIDPNPAAVTAEYILQVFIEANRPKVEAAIAKAAMEADKNHSGERP